MELQSVYRKTPKGEQEIATRACGLSARGRSVLIMVDGRISGADLLKRAAMLGDGDALLGTLIDGGFIEAVGAGAGSAPEVPMAPAAFGAAQLDTVRYASRFLLGALGPAADAMGVRIEACRDSQELAKLLADCREMIQAGAGRRKAEEFWAEVLARLPGMSAGG